MIFPKDCYLTLSTNDSYGFNLPFILCNTAEVSGEYGPHGLKPLWTYKEKDIIIIHVDISSSCYKRAIVISMPRSLNISLDDLTKEINSLLFSSGEIVKEIIEDNNNSPTNYVDYTFYIDDIHE